MYLLGHMKQAFNVAIDICNHQCILLDKLYLKDTVHSTIN
jgi:hypothetical protein